MPIFSHLHQLFHADTCHAYIHRLRWKDRPLQCPRCQSYDVGPWGTYHYRPRCKRYRCRACKRTFNDLTGTLFDRSKRSLAHWILATFLLCLSCSARRIARELGIHIRTGYRWCWWLRNAALSYEMDRQLEGTVEADDLYHTAGHKGQSKHGGKKALGRRPRGRRKKREPGRGHYDKDHPAVIAWVSRHGLVVVHGARDFTVKTVQKAAAIAVKTGSHLYTDSASSYRALKGYVHAFVNHTKKEYARGDVHENRAECLFSLLKPYLRRPPATAISSHRRSHPPGGARHGAPGPLPPAPALTGQGVHVRAGPRGIICAQRPGQPRHTSASQRPAGARCGAPRSRSRGEDGAEPSGGY